MGRALLAILLVLSFSSFASARLGLQVRTPFDTPTSTTPVVDDSAQARVLPREDGIINVRTYGAIGDGLVDDAPAINAAIEATDGEVAGYTWAMTGGTVHIPPGTYRIASTIIMRNNVRLTGAGKWNTVIVVDADCNGITVPADCQNWSIENLTIRARTTGPDIAAAGIAIGTGARFFSVSGVAIAYPHSSAPQFDYGIHIAGGDGLAVYVGHFLDVTVFRARQYCLYAMNAIQCRFYNCFFSGRSVQAVARIGGTANGFYGCTFEGYDIGLHIVGSNNIVDGCWFEQDGHTRQNVWCMVIERTAAAYNAWERGLNNLISGGSWTVSLTDDTCGYVKIVGGNGNLFQHTRFNHVEGTLVRIEGSYAYHNSFLFGNMPWSQIISVENPSVNSFDYFSNRGVSPSERKSRLWAGVAATEWHMGNHTNGLKARTYCTQDEMTDSNTPGLYTTRDGGSAPFNATGNLIIRPKKAAKTSVEIWTGAPPEGRFRVTDDTAIFMVGIQPDSQSDEAMPNNTIYFSMDANKLVYKDPNGVVNTLY